MKKTNRKKQHISKGNTPSVRTQMHDYWLQKRPIIYFVGRFAVLIALFYTIWLSTFFENRVTPYIINGYAGVANALLQLLGQHTSLQQELIYDSGFSISVKKGCDAVEAMALFMAAVLAFPMSWQLKAKSASIGLILMALVNILRIASLFLIGKYAPTLFETFHVEVWPVLFIVLALSLWLFFIFKSIEPTKNITHVTAK